LNWARRLASTAHPHWFWKTAP